MFWCLLAIAVFLHIHSNVCSRWNVDYVPVMTPLQIPRFPEIQQFPSAAASTLAPLFSSWSVVACAANPVLVSMMESVHRRLVLRIDGVSLRVVMESVHHRRLCLLMRIDLQQALMEPPQNFQRDNIAYGLSKQIHDQSFVGTVDTSWVLPSASWCLSLVKARMRCRKSKKTSFSRGCSANLHTYDLSFR